MNILAPKKTTALIVVLLSLNLGLSAAVFGQRLEVELDGDDPKEAAAEIVAENRTEATTEAEPADLSGDVQIVSAKSVFSGKYRLSFVHECQGEVRTSEVVQGGLFGKETAKYCVGKNFLSLKDAGAAEIALISEAVSTSTEDAPILESVTFVSASKGYSNGTILVEYAVVPCSVSEDSCGVGIPSNRVTYAVNVATKEVRSIANYPDNGSPIWNATGTKAIFPVVQRGGAGCDDGPIVGYDLTTDTTKVLLQGQTACELNGSPRLNTDVEGRPMPSWGPTFWTSDSTFTTEILGVDEKWEQIDGAF